MREVRTAELVLAQHSIPHVRMMGSRSHVAQIQNAKRLVDLANQVQEECGCGIFCKPHSESDDSLTYSTSSDYVSPESESLESQSGVEMGQMTQENVVFDDEEENYEDGGDDFVDTIVKSYRTDNSLDQFFRRPIRIRQFEWDVNSALTDIFNPWELFFENSRVSNRITNYNLLRADLHVKFVINGNAFYYGRLMASYFPIQGLGKDEDQFTRNIYQQDFVQASQVPKVLIDPTRSVGGTIMCPFMWWYNYAHIPDSDFEAMGRIVVRSLNTLQHATGNTDSLTVSVFAWAENVALEMPTSVDTDTLTPQSGVETEVDEVNRKGYISKVATNVAAMARVAGQISFLKPYAMATEIAAGAVAGVARIFGFSRPIITAGPEPYRPQIVGSMALCNAPDTSQKLSVDDKQELTVDPRVCGFESIDPLAISSIAGRETYLDTFTWTAGGGTSNNLLWNCRVDPNIATQDVINQWHFPATAMAAMPFMYWSGSLKYRFQVVCSGFHRGRLMIAYDPNFWSVGAAIETNVVYNDIIDISNVQDITVVVPPGQPYSLMKTCRPGDLAATELISTTPYVSQVETAGVRCGNGVLGVWVINDLTTPDAANGQSIEINVFISACDDFEVHVPDDWFSRFEFMSSESAQALAAQKPELEAQSGAENNSQGAIQNTVNAPENTHMIYLGPKHKISPDHTKMFAGERVESLRTLLKRYNFWRSVKLGDAGDIDLNTTSLKFAFFPQWRGFAFPGNLGMDDALGPRDYNYCSTVLLHWVSGAFRGFRGSMRYKFMALPDNFNGKIYPNVAGCIQRYARENVEEYEPPAWFRGGLTPDATDTAFWGLQRTTATGSPQNVLNGINGCAVFDSRTNPTVEWEIPFYSNYRMASGRHANYAALDTYNAGGYQMRVYNTGNQGARGNIYVSAGEDFQGYFFMGIPRANYNPIDPTPV